MKPVRWAALLVAVGACSGCIFMGPEDRDFYGKGWVKPAELDAPMPHHAIQDPSHPETAAAPTRTPSADAAAPWLMPEQAAQ